MFWRDKDKEEKKSILKNLIISAGFIIFLTLLLSSCKSSSTKTQDSQNQTDSGLIDSFFPPKNKGIFPDDIQIYVILKQKPTNQDVRFIIWRNGNQIPGKIILEEIKEQGKYKVRFEPFQKEEGTYVVYFNYGLESIFWTFWAEITRTIPIFPLYSYPPSDAKNFPVGSSISISIPKPPNPYTIDEETLRFMKIDLSGEKEELFYASYLPGSLIIIPDKMESSSNYKVMLTGIAPIDEINPSTINYETGFRTQDLEKPSIVSCNPRFCTLSSCETIKGNLFDIWVQFQENEELSFESVLDNFRITIDSPSGTEIVDFSKIYLYDIFSKSLKLISEKNLPQKRSLFIYPNKIEVRFEDMIQPTSTVRIYVLPSLADSSGNQINDFFSWCIQVVP